MHWSLRSAEEDASENEDIRSRQGTRNSHGNRKVQAHADPHGQIVKELGPLRELQSVDDEQTQQEQRQSLEERGIERQERLIKVVSELSSAQAPAPAPTPTRRTRRCIRSYTRSHTRSD